MMHSARSFAVTSVTGRFVRFCLVGASGVMVDMAVLSTLADPRMLGWSLILSKVCAAEVATVNNFIWNDLWTFQGLAADRRSLVARLKLFAKFNLICSGGIVISTATLKMLAHGLGMNVYLANLLAIVTATAWNFGMSFVFNWGAGKAWKR